MVKMSRLSVLTLFFSLFLLLIPTAVMFAEEACCLPDCECTNLEPQDCIDQGGTPLGTGTECSFSYGACCIEEGVCEQMDSVCCVENGFSFYASYSCTEFTCDSTCEYRRFEINRLADYNGDGPINVGDLSYLMTLINSGEKPYFLPIFDANGDCYVERSDLIRLHDWCMTGWEFLEPAECTCIDPVWYGDSCNYQSPGDVDNDGDIDLADATYLTAWLYAGGPEPPVLANADPNGSCCTDSTDIVYISEYLFQGGPAPVECTCVDIELCPGTCCVEPGGDANGDGATDVGDAVYIINYAFKGGPAPGCLSEGDANNDGSVDVGDAVYIINYAFKGGPTPVCGSID
ncbi:MAG: hypothetical protein KAR42_09835 [candidate division Zixibacteria bacterium]|nr:hypothetical protein [candidate division Zixibacteria bacterium]